MNKKLHIGNFDKAKNQKNFSLNLKVYEKLFNLSNIACGVQLSIPQTVEFLINYYENSKINDLNNVVIPKYLPTQTKRIARK